MSASSEAETSKQIAIQDTNGYTNLKFISNGLFGKVYSGLKEFALIKMDLTRKESAEKEYEMMRLLESQFTVKAFEIYCDPRNVFIAMELMKSDLKPSSKNQNR